MSQRIERMKITGSLYDALYEDALRRQERHLIVSKMLPPGVTFQPNIGSGHDRPSNDDTKEDFVNRLAYSKSHSERWLSMQRQQQPEASQNSHHPEFHPQVGRGPLQERNKEGLPIGEFLYKVGQERAAQSQVQAVQDEERERSQSQTRKIGDISQHLFEETKQRKYRDIYQALTSRDSEERLRATTLNLEGLDEALVEFLRPMVAYLHETGECLDFSSFVAALDYQRNHSAAPTAHLFVQKSSARTSEKYKQERDGENFTPRTDPRSQKIAARHRPRGAPLHDQLLREKEIWDSKRSEQRALLEEQQLSECTFQPNSRRPRSAGSTNSRTSACSGGAAGRGQVSNAIASLRSPRSGSAPPVGRRQHPSQQSHQQPLYHQHQEAHLPQRREISLGHHQVPSHLQNDGSLQVASTKDFVNAASETIDSDRAKPPVPLAMACGTTCGSSCGWDAVSEALQAEQAVAHCRSLLDGVKETCPDAVVAHATPADVVHGLCLY